MRTVQQLHLDRLVHFHAVAKHGSLRRAAAAMSLTPPALTRSLQKLEDEIGETLCVRGRAGVRLTAEGERLLDVAERVISELQGYLDTPDEPDAYRGIVGIGFIEAVELPAVDVAIDRMIRRYPRCRLNLVVASSDQLARLVDEDELDVAFSVFDRELPGLRYRPVATEAFRYYISRRHALWPRRQIRRRDLEGQRVAWIDHERLDRHELETYVFRDRPGQAMSVGAFSNHVDGGLRLLMSGHAVVPMPRPFVKPLLAAGEIRELSIRPHVDELVTYCVDDPARTPRAPIAFLLEELGLAPTQRAEGGSL